MGGFLHGRLFLQILFCLIILTGFSGCNETNLPSDTKYLKDFHFKYLGNFDSTRFASKTEPILQKNELALYVDHSQWIKHVQQDPFYTKLIPVLGYNTKHYFSIKGSVIEEETDLTHSIQDLLTKPKIVKDADFGKALDFIINSDREAILLTDGEYHLHGASQATNPFLAYAFTRWLKKGHDVYIIAKPYREGKRYEKKIFYFIFTDHRLKGNIYEQIRDAVDLRNDFPEVDTFHLSACPTVDKKNFCVNPDIVAKADLPTQREQYDGFEIQEWLMDWNIIEKNVMEMPQQDGKKNGDYVMKGLKFDTNSYAGFKISDIEIKVYNINDEYFTFYNTMDTAGNIDDKIFPKPCEDAFIIFDTTEFKRHGSVNLYFDISNWNPGNILTGDPCNYTKIDICAKFQKIDKKDNEHLFDFDDIFDKTTGNARNSSVTESIRQCLYDLQQEMSSVPLYTIYIKSNKYK